MSKVVFLMRAAFAGLALGLLSACTATYADHGYVPTDYELAKIAVGKDTQETVAQALGHPSLEGVLNSHTWYYIQSHWRSYGISAPKEMTRDVVAISFDAKGRVENIGHFGLEKGRVITISRRVTTSNVRGVSFLKQMIGDIGNLRPGTFGPPGLN